MLSRGLRTHAVVPTAAVLHAPRARANSDRRYARLWPAHWPADTDAFARALEYVRIESDAGCLPLRARLPMQLPTPSDSL